MIQDVQDMTLEQLTSDLRKFSPACQAPDGEVTHQCSNDADIGSIAETQIRGHVKGTAGVSAPSASKFEHICKSVYSRQTS